MPIHYQNETCETLKKVIPVHWVAITDARNSADWYYKATWLGVPIRISLDTGDHTWFAVTTIFGETLVRHGRTPSCALRGFVTALSFWISYNLNKVQEQEKQIYAPTEKG